VAKTYFARLPFQFLSRIFLFVAFAFIVWLLIA
jgi:hypothetical protein